MHSIKAASTAVFQLVVLFSSATYAARHLLQDGIVPSYIRSDTSGCQAGSTPSVNGFPGTPYTLSIFKEKFENAKTWDPMVSYCDASGRCIDAYSIDVTATEVDLRTGCQGPKTRVMAYGGQVPGPTIEARVGREVLVRFNNMIQTDPVLFVEHEPCTGNRSGHPISIHLHGSASLSGYDGWAEDEICGGESKDYLYPSNRPATGWYHDHALDITSNNANFGLAAMMPIRDPVERWGLQGMEEYRLMLSDKVMDSQCQIRFETAGVHQDMYYGDINLVSGIPFPWTEVEPKWVRFRLVNAAVTRPYLVKIVKIPAGTSPQKPVEVGSTFCQVIASDGGFRSSPVPFPSTGVFMGVAERYEFVCDFSKVKGETLYLWNEYDKDRTKDVPYFCYSNLLMKMNVLTQCKSGSPDCAGQPVFAPTYIPTHLERTINQDEIKKATNMAKSGACTRTFEFGRSNGKWTINGETWSTRREAASNIGTNSWEVWCLKTGGGWFHPVHVHLVDFFVVYRSKGSYPIQDDYEKMVPKDVMQLHPGSEIAAVVMFGPHRGEYMFHCHNLRHEDVEMMRSFSNNRSSGARSARVPDLSGVTSLEYSRSKSTGLLYDSYSSAVAGNTNAKPTSEWPAINEDYLQTYIEKELYRLFYPRSLDLPELCNNNPWAVKPNSCP